MSWKDRLQKAKFKDVDISVEYTQWSRGRRVPVRELVGQDVSVQQDLGRAPDTIEVQAFFFGDKFDQERDALEAALLTEGATTLTLPTRGQLDCRVISGPITSENDKEQGFVTVRFTVVLEPRKGASAASAAKSAAGLKAKADTAKKLKAAATSTNESAASKIAAVIARGMPSAALKSAVKAINAVSNAAGTIQNVIQSQTNAVEDVSAAISNLTGTANQILGSPGALVSAVTGIVLGVFNLADTSNADIDRTTGLLLGGALTPFEKAAPARAVITALKVMSALGSDAVTSTGVSIGTGTVPPATVSTVGGGGPVGAPPNTSAAAIGAAAVASATGASSSSSSSSTSASSVAASGGSVGGGSSSVPSGSATAGSAAAQRALAALSPLSVSDQEIMNARSIYEGARGLGIGAAASIFATATFDSSTLALTALETLSDAIDLLQEYASSDDLVDALNDLRGAAADHLTAVASSLPASATFSAGGLVSIKSTSKTASLVIGQGPTNVDGVNQQRGAGVSAGLPRVVNYQPPREVPAILIAYEVYGDPDLADDIIARNNARYPLFVGGEIELIEP